MFTKTGKKQSTAAIAIFDVLPNGPNHAFVIGAKAMIGIALAAIAYGWSARPSRRQRASTSATRIPSPQPISQPPSASWNVNQPPWSSSPRLSQKLPAIADRLRREEALDVEDRDRRLPDHEHEHEDDRGRQPVERPAPDAPRERAARDRRDGDRLRAHLRHRVEVGAEVQRLAHARDELEVPRLLARLRPARVRQVDVDDVRDRGRGAAT